MKFIVKNKGEDYEFEWIDETNFEDLDKVTHVEGFFYDDENKICVVDCEHDGKWTRPGGGRERGETSDEALYREIKEEADLDLGELKRIGYYKISKNGEVIEHHPKYVAKIKQIKEQTINPDEGIISKRKFVSEDEFREIFSHHKDVEFLLERARKKLRYKKVKSAAAIIFHKDKFMIVKKSKEWGGFWDFPKGGIKKGEEELDALHREMKEETNLEIEVIPGFYEEIHYNYSDEVYDYDKTVGYYLAKAKTIDCGPNDEEIEECMWATEEEVREKVKFEDVIMVFEKALGKLK